jgi:TolB-like protein/Tfp pilus assembly protein PilF
MMDTLESTNPAAVNDQVKIIQNSPVFSQVERLGRFLAYIVTTELEGDGDRITQTSIAIDVLGRDADFDPVTDSIVRMEASRLRSKLRDYYDSDGKDDVIRIDLPKGKYRPRIRVQESIAPAVQSTTQTQESDAISIAVLPFTNLTGDDKQEYLSDGISEEIINALNRISGLRVAARTSAFAFKHKEVEIKVIGEQLNVQYVLEGSVRRDGHHVRITTQLIKVKDGYQIWSNTFDRDITDIFALQDDIARAIAEALTVKLGMHQHEKLVVPGTPNLEAYHDYLQGRYWINKWGTKNFDHAAECFQRAINLDPDFAEAHGCLAYTYGITSVYNRFYDYLPKLESSRIRALELDPNQPEALASCFRLFGQTFDWQEIKHEFDWALNGHADNSLIVSQYVLSYLYPLSRFDEGMQLLDQVAKLDPLSPLLWVARARMVYAGGDMREAATLAETALDIDRENYMALYLLGELYPLLNESDKAESIVVRLRDVAGENDPFALYCKALLLQREDMPEGAEVIRQTLIQHWASTWTPYPAPYYIGRLSIFLGNIEQGLFWFDVAFHEKDFNLCRIRSQYRNIPEVWDHPRCRELVELINLDDASVTQLINK